MPSRMAPCIWAPTNDVVVMADESLSEAPRRFAPSSTAPLKSTPTIIAFSRLAQRRSALRRSGHVSKMAFGRASAAHPPRDLPGSGGRLPPQGLGGGRSVAGAARGIGGGGSAVASGLGGGGSVVEAASGLGGGGGEGGLGGGESGLGNGRPADGGKVAPGAGTLARGEANAPRMRPTAVPVTPVRARSTSLAPVKVQPSTLASERSHVWSDAPVNLERASSAF
mmetsp:Transcript_44735/g.145362  ORF Transcript_44735/g.145362 Transcript_44735/m.145362 type:complete len:224 (+) Transcript_44735:172-843(+)